MGAKEFDGCRQADHVLFFVVVQLLGVLGAYQAGGDDGGCPIQPGVVVDIFEGFQNLDVLEKALRDLLALYIASEVLQTENLSLAGQGKLRIERRPIDLVFLASEDVRFS